MTKNIKLTVRSTQYISLPTPDGDDGHTEFDMLEPSVTTVESAGEMRHENGVVTIEYQESPVTGLEDCITSISFTDAEPGRITVFRSGPVKTALMFCEDQRYISVYETEMGNFEVGIYTQKCENALGDNGGTISISYNVEIRGSAAEHTELDIKVRVTE